MIAPGGPGFTFNSTGILANAPAMSGVYAIYKPSAWIYIGESRDVQARLLEHLNGDNACILQQGPTGFQCEAVAANQRVARQDALILALAPTCNRRLG